MFHLQYFAQPDEEPLHSRCCNQRFCHNAMPEIFSGSVSPPYPRFQKLMRKILINHTHDVFKISTSNSDTSKA